MKKIIAFMSGLTLVGCVNSSYQDNEIPVVEEPTGEIVAGREEIPVVNENVKVLPAEQQNVIEIPAQTIMIADSGYMIPQQQIPVPEQIMVLPQNQPVVIQTPAVMPQPMPVYQPQEVVITLQSRTYPVQYMQCLSTDTNCLNSAYAQGFMPVQYAPQFAGYQSVPGPTDYPAGGRWWNSNNVPRW